ncbi:Aste57867_20083 [Aphanomyces stellatus]|uniref:Protoporphyrinogen oxidase n=1 Tax=Aphanomyces stellatus TaxID=120398 RepID=A0A485LG31_9STRA|nr:hypothetical protein As57867_020017 [Aphanomyces stellatus]VFT96778.1 Aste57867_20083 [Aphanomyces stellatus]
MKNIVVVGGGISGLSLVHQLRKRIPAAVRIQLIEAKSRVGGWIKTDETDRFLFEAGPRGFRPSRNGAEMLHLVEELGLQNECIQSAGSNRYIFTHGKITKAPSTPLEFLQWPLAFDVVQAVLREMFVPRATASDESVYDFISRRFSPVVAERLIDPMASGIFGGNIRHLSMRSCFGLLWDMEQAHGSIVRAMLFHPSPKPTTLLDGTPLSPFVQTVGMAMSVSFRHGMQTFTDAMATHVAALPNTEIHVNTSVESIKSTAPSGALVDVQLADGTPESIAADHVFSALPAHRLASVLGDAPAVVAHLERLHFTSMGIVTLGFDRNLIANPGFGYLVPTCEKQPVLGVIYDSCSFPEQNKTTTPSTRLSVFLGGENHPHMACMTDADRQAIALSTIQRHLDVADTPSHVSSQWLDKCIPQYTVGFHSLVADIERELAQAVPALTLVGNSFYGVGLADSVHRSTAAALAFAQTHVK